MTCESIPVIEITNADNLPGATSTNVGWRVPEVNIGILCANAPIFRPLYLYFRGRLVTQRRTNTAASSKDRIWPSNAERIRLPGGGTIGGTGGSEHEDDRKVWHHGSGDTAVEIEMGLPVGGDAWKRDVAAEEAEGEDGKKKSAGAGGALLRDKPLPRLNSGAD